MKKILSILLLLSFFAKGQGPTLIKAKQLGDGLGTGSFVVTGGPNGSFTYAAISSYSFVPTSSLSLYQLKLNGTGFVVANGTVITYDNNTYLTTSSAAGLYVPYVGANSFTTSNNITAASFISTGQSTFNTLYVPSTSTVNGAFLANSTGTITGALKALSTVSVASNLTVTSLSYLTSSVQIGTAATATDILQVNTTATGSGALIGNARIGVWGSSANYAVFRNQQANDATGYALVQDNSGFTYLNASTQVQIAVGTNAVATFTDRKVDFNPVLSTSGSNINFNFTCPSSTGLAASTNIPYFKIVGGTKQWSTGAITNQYFNYLSNNTAAFVGASTITDCYNTYIESCVAGTNATLTRKYSLGTSDNVAFGIANSTAALYLGVAPASTNWALSAAAGAGSMYLNAPTSGFVVVSVGSANRMQVNNTSIGFTPGVQNGGSTPAFNFTNPNNTSRSLSTEIPGFKYIGGTQQWAAGTITIQRDFYLSSTTYGFVSASTVSDGYGFYSEAPTAGTNATITRAWAAGFNGNVSATSYSSATTSTLEAGYILDNQGTNAWVGNATLVGGSVVVSNTVVDANSYIILTRKTSGGTIGTAITYSIINGTSFTITSDNILDTSVFTWQIVKGH